MNRHGLGQNSSPLKEAREDDHGRGTGKRTNIWGGGEMASKGLAVTMVPLSPVTVGTDLPEY